MKSLSLACLATPIAGLLAGAKDLSPVYPAAPTAGGQLPRSLSRVYPGRTAPTAGLLWGESHTHFAGHVPSFGGHEYLRAREPSQFIQAVDQAIRIFLK